MSDLISPDELAAALAECCRKYTDEIVKKVEDGIESIGMEARQEVKELSPVFDGNDKNISKGAYRRSRASDIEKERGEITVTVHVKGKHYRLTHLLENGHLTRLGTGRKYYGEFGKKYSQPVPHISIANEHAQKKAEKLLEDL